MVRFVVMAAGQATRMGQDKLVLPWKDTTVLGHTVRTLLKAMMLSQKRMLGESFSPADIEIYVVARHGREAYLTQKCIGTFDGLGGVWVQVPSPEPLAATIRYGLQNLNSSIQCVGFLPGDQVGVKAETLVDCLLEVGQNPPDFLVPVAGNKAVSPVIFHRRYVPELLELRGEQGGREVLYRYPDRWRKYPVQESFFKDIDTPEQYNAWRVQNYEDYEGESSE